jgi:hypothetical protein
MQHHQIIGFPYFDTLWPHCLQTDKHLLLTFLIYYSSIRDKLVAQFVLHNEEESQNQTISSVLRTAQEISN